MDKFEIGLAAAEIYDFVWSEFCDWYIELSKPYLYSDNKEKRSATLAVLCYVLREILKLAHPIIPFITAEIYDNLPNKDAEDIMVAEYPVHNFASKDGRRLMLKKSVGEMNIVREIIKSVRVMRNDMKVSQTKRTAMFVKANDGFEKLVEKSLIYIEKLAGGSSIEMVKAQPSGKNAAVVTEAAEVYIPMGELIDYAKEIERLNKELDTVKSEIARAEGKLKNEGFVKKAPASLIEAEKAKIAKYAEQKLHIEETIAKLKEI